MRKHLLARRERESDPGTRWRERCASRSGASTLCVVVLAWLVTPVPAAELELFVTDYNEDPAPTQAPLVARPVTYVDAQQVTVRTSDGKTIAYDAPAKVAIQSRAAGDPRAARLFASRGEYEPFSFLLRPLENLTDVFIKAGALTGPGGTIPADCVTVRSVEGFHGGGRQILMRLGHPWNMSAYSTEYFWYMVRVPDTAAPGTYRGTVTVTSQQRPVGTIAVNLDVLPLRLKDPPFALGFNYSRPENAQTLPKHLADMREHGMTTVAPLYEFHLPIHDDDTSQLGEFIEVYRRAGFPAPLYFATPMGLQVSDLAGYGDETSKRWQQKYLQVMRRLHAETLKHDVPVLMSIGDELTNKGIEGVGIAERLARFVWEELPEIATTSDMNGYREVMAMAPYLNVATFNNGWDGIDHHNGGRRLINRDFILQLQRQTGAIPWFVNGGSGRFPIGFFFWKMTKHGVRGKVEWYYNLRNESGSLVRDTDAGIEPTLDYERSREGVDDLKYLCGLESLIAQARKTGRASADCAAAEALVGRIAAGIQDDWTAYSAGAARFPPDGFAVTDPDKAAGLGSLDAIRRAVADAAVRLQEALGTAPAR